MGESIVEVWRGHVVESKHRVHVAVVDAQGELRAFAGDPSLVAYARSAVKPIQALPLVEDGVADRYDFSEQELALCCASHNGEPRHVDIVRGMLRKIGADEEGLACGAQVPMGKRAARQLANVGRAPGRIHNNCSGKHAGMMALARYYSWPLVGYHLAEHPVQQRMLSEIAHWSGTPADEIPIAVDGCGVSTFALPLDHLAGAFARMAQSAHKGEGPAAIVVNAMTRNPEYVAGAERLCTELMRVARGRIFAKVGAEGVYCAGVPGAELGIALKVEDGATRASEPALIAALRTLALLSDEELAQLDPFVEPEITNTRGERVGGLRAQIWLTAAS